MTLTTVAGSVIQPVGITVVSAGPRMATLMWRSVHGLGLPASSTTRVRRVCSPCVPIVIWNELAFEDCSGPLLSCHSTRSTPEFTSEPLMTTSVGPFCHTFGSGVTVSSLGSVASMRTVSPMREWTLPASSTARVSSR